MRDDGGFFTVVMGIEHDMLDTLRSEHRRKKFRHRDRARPDQYRPLQLLMRCEATTAAHFCLAVGKIRMPRDARRLGPLVGIQASGRA